MTIEDRDWKSVANLRKLARRAVAATIPDDRVALSILFTGDQKISELNSQWRGKAKPTNVLSFPVASSIPVPEGQTRAIGDIVLAYGTIVNEAEQQKKPLANHVTHLIVHGTLHLLGYDHENDADAENMEALEIEILARLGIENPYQS